MDKLAREKLEVEQERKRLKVVLRGIKALLKDITAFDDTKEVKPKNETSAAEMMTALVASTGGKRYGWADRFGVDEKTIRDWASGKTQPKDEHPKLIRAAYKELAKK